MYTEFAHTLVFFFIQIEIGIGKFYTRIMSE